MGRKDWGLESRGGGGGPLAPPLKKTEGSLPALFPGVLWAGEGVHGLPGLHNAFEGLQGHSNVTSYFSLKTGSAI